MKDLSKMQARWPDGTAGIIGARRKDYGEHHPVMPWRARLAAAIGRQFKNEGDKKEARAVLAVCLLIAVCLAALCLLTK